MLQLTTILFLIAGTILATIHTLAVKLYLYWKVWWFDLPMHFLGGVVIALLAFTLYDLRIIPRSFISLFKVMLFVMLAAVIWEIYEYLAGTVYASNYILDTATDLFMGLSGGFIGYYVASKIRNLS